MEKKQNFRCAKAIEVAKYRERARYKAIMAGLVLLTEIYHIAFSDDPLGFSALVVTAIAAWIYTAETSEILFGGIAVAKGLSCLAEKAIGSVSTT